MNARRARGVVLVVAGAAALAGMLGALGGLGWWLELFAHFRPQYAAALLVCAAALVVLRRPAPGFAVAALAALNALPLAHYYVPRPAAATGTLGLSAVALNLFDGNGQKQRVIDYVRAASPDLVLFSEVTVAWRQALAALGDEFRYQAWTGDVMVASKRPLASVRSLPAMNGEEWALMFTVGAGDAVITVVGAHAHWPLGPAVAAARNRELAMIASLSHMVAGPFVVLGDLNTTAFSPVFRGMLAAGRLADCAAGRGFMPTWPARVPLLYLQIDHCLHGPGVEVARLATGPYVGSDHYPLEVDLRLRAADPDMVTASNGVPTSRR